MKKLTSPIILIKDSFEIFIKKENFIFLTKIYSPLAALSLISLSFIYIPLFSNFFETTTGDRVMALFNIFFAIVAIFIDLAGTMAVIKIIDKDDLNVKETFKKSISRYWKFFILTVLIYLMSTLGLILLVFPLILVATWFSFSRFIFVEKELGVMKALSESKKLVKGNFWRVFLRMFVFGLFYVLAQMLLVDVPYYIGSIIFYLCGSLFVIPYFLLHRELSNSKINE